MSRYAPVASTPSSPTTPTRRSSFASIRRPSISSFRFGSSRDAPLPDPDEMDAAFEGPDDEDENHALLSQHPQTPRKDERMPGDYDFERDYTQPPPSPPPFQPYSSHNPAPGNTNGVVPTGAAARPAPPRHFLGGILPTSILPRQQHPRGVVGAGNAGVFNNLSARPDGEVAERRRGEGPDYVPEEEQKDGPPSYQAALRDAVPPYWDTTVVLPSSSSPFGPLSSSVSGDEILIDGMPSGNFFGFFWNMIVSVSFQFVGFLLTYVLHTTHAAKFGSRVGLGLTLIQFGFNLRTRAVDLIESGRFPTDPSDPDPPAGMNEDEIKADNALKAFMGGGVWPQQVKDPNAPPNAPPVMLHNLHEAEIFAQEHGMNLTGSEGLLGLPSAADVGRANEYFSFILMSIGWFLVLTSLGGWWRVKRFENGLRAAQRESEQAQAAAAANREGGDESAAAANEPTTTPVTPGPNSLVYYTSAFRESLRGANELRRGFFGMNGRPIRGGHGHAPLPQDEHELLDAQGFGLEPMASSNEDGQRRGRGLWGI